MYRLLSLLFFIIFYSNLQGQSKFNYQFVTNNQDYKDNHLVYAYVNLNMCYNCNLIIGEIRDLASDSNYKVKFFFTGISQSKMNLVKKEYNLTEEMIALNEGYYFELLQNYYNKNIGNASLYYQDNPFYYVIGQATYLFNEFKKELKFTEEKIYNDTFYYTGFNSLTLTQKSLYFTTYPKNDLYTIIDDKIVQMDLNQYYYDTNIVENFLALHITKKNGAINTYETIKYLNDFLNQQKAANLKVACEYLFEKNNEIFGLFFSYFPIWKDSTESSIMVMPITYLAKIEPSGGLKFLNIISINDSKKLADRLQPFYPSGAVKFNFRNFDTIQFAIASEKYVKGDIIPTSLKFCYRLETNEYHFINAVDSISCPINYDKKLAFNFTNTLQNKIDAIFYQALPLFKMNVHDNKLSQFGKVGIAKNDTTKWRYNLLAVERNSTDSKRLNMLVYLGANYLYLVDYDYINNEIVSSLKISKANSASNATLFNNTIYSISNFEKDESSYFKISTYNLK